MPEDPHPEAPPEEPRPSWLPLPPLPRVQAIVGVAAGALTIIVTGGSLLGFNAYRMPVQGELVASVSASKYRTPLRDATIEILTPTAAVVTTLTVDEHGRIQHRLREGQYRLRVTHPQYLPDQKDVQVWAGQRADIRIALASRPPAPKPVVVAPSKKAEDGVRKFFGKLGL